LTIINGKGALQIWCNKGKTERFWGEFLGEKMDNFLGSGKFGIYCGSIKFKTLEIECFCLCGKVVFIKK
jgi:hypothetical protein